METPGMYIYAVKSTVQREQRKVSVLKLIFVFFFLLWSPIISVSLGDAAVPVTEGDNIGGVFDWNKTRGMPICAANPISSSSDGMA